MTTLEAQIEAFEYICEADLSSSEEYVANQVVLLALTDWVAVLEGMPNVAAALPPHVRRVVEETAAMLCETVGHDLIPAGINGDQRACRRCRLLEPLE